MNNIIKGLRSLRGYTQEKTANAIGITVRTYCRKEQNPNLFTVGEIKKLATFLDVEEKIFFEKQLTFKAS